VFTSTEEVVHMAGEASFDAFYLATRDAVLRQLTAMTLDRELAADTVQEAFVRAWQRWSRVSLLDDPTAWVRVVAWRLALSHFRRRTVADRLFRRLDRGPAEPELAAEVGLDVLRALHALSPEHRRVIVLHELVGMSVREVAAEAGVAEGTVKSRLSRARERLRASLGSDYLDAATDVEPAALEREEERR
jgi:RNA polymerase sigma-70 factor (ECF subfamily)